MYVFLIALLICISTYFYFDNSNKINAQKNQILIYKNQKKIISNFKTQPIVIKYIKPEKESGILNSDTELLLYPMDKAVSVSKLSKELSVSITDSAEISDELWYYITIPSTLNVNCKGWVKSKYIDV